VEFCADQAEAEHGGGQQDQAAKLAAALLPLGVVAAGLVRSSVVPPGLL
jgi:hypothetical protein